MTLAGAFSEFARYASPRILLAFFSVLMCVRLWLGAYAWADLVIVGAILLGWPFLEWIIHVYALHFRPVTIWGFTIDPYVAQKHRRHHRDPWNLKILFIPLRTYVFTIPMHLVLWNLAFDAAQAFTGLAMFFALTLHYEWVHYLTHSRYKPRSWMYQRLWRSHRLHHCKNENYWLGVSMLLGDRVLGTSKDKDEVPTSATCRTLGQADSLGS